MVFFWTRLFLNNQNSFGKESTLQSSRWNQSTYFCNKKEAAVLNATCVNTPMIVCGIRIIFYRVKPNFLLKSNQKWSNVLNDAVHSSKRTKWMVRSKNSKDQLFQFTNSEQQETLCMPVSTEPLEYCSNKKNTKVSCKTNMLGCLILLKLAFLFLIKVSPNCLVILSNSYFEYFEY